MGAAFTSTIKGTHIEGNRRIAWGTFASTGTGVGGDISTGLTSVEFIKIQPTGTAIITNACVVNEALPMAGGAVTIVTDADVAGVWWAQGL